jgi:hypothetical protein
LLEELIQMIGPKISRAANATKDERAKMVDFLVDLGTGIWRVRRKIDGLSRMPREIRDALYSLESMWMAMSQDGVEIVDHIGTTPSGREAKIVEFREIQGLTREQVVDAVKPTIILKGEVVQMGEVVMGRPKRAAVSTADVRAAEPESDDETPVPVHEVETITMTPPLLKWSPAEEKTSEEKGPDAPVMPASDETPESLPEDRKPDVTDVKRPSAEIPDGPLLDPETAAIVEAEEEKHAAEIAAAGEASAESAVSQDADAEPPAPKKTRRRKAAAETAVNAAQDTATENGGTPDKKTAGRKTRTYAARKPRKKAASAPEDTDVTPKEEA